MPKYGSYRIFPKERMIFEYHSGEIVIEDFIRSKEVISSDNEYNPDYDVIIDIRDINIIFNYDDINKLVDFYKTYSPIKGNRKLAFLTKKPQHVVFTTLFSNGIDDTLVNANFFSTAKAAAGWIINSTISVQIIKKIFEELKKSSNTLYSSEEKDKCNIIT